MKKNSFLKLLLLLLLLQISTTNYCQAQEDMITNAKSFTADWCSSVVVKCKTGAMLSINWNADSSYIHSLFERSGGKVMVIELVQDGDEYSPNILYVDFAESKLNFFFNSKTKKLSYVSISYTPDGKDTEMTKHDYDKLHFNFLEQLKQAKSKYQNESQAKKNIFTDQMEISNTYILTCDTSKVTAILVFAEPKYDSDWNLLKGKIELSYSRE
jgi:hypothetical protein